MLKPQERSCVICHELFRPNPRSRRGRGYRQKACSNPACQRERKRRQRQRWVALNPKYTERRKKEIPIWAKAKDYWKQWRKDHPEYRTRDNRRRCLAAKIARRSAKSTQIKALCAERLSRIQELAEESKNSAKSPLFFPLGIALADYLVLRDRSAKPPHIDLGSPSLG